MKRTLMQLGIAALEDMFATSKTDAKALRQLENELQYRQVPRAVALLEQVQVAMKRLASDLPAPGLQAALPLESEGGSALESLPPPQPERRLPSVRVSSTAKVGTCPETQNAAQATATGAKKGLASPAPVERAPIPAMSVDDACEVLKVSLGASWQDVELSRRKMVLLSHPRHVVGMLPERQEAVRTEARRVNAAYVTLSVARVAR